MVFNMINIKKAILSDGFYQKRTRLLLAGSLIYILNVIYLSILATIVLSIGFLLAQEYRMIHPYLPQRKG